MRGVALSLLLACLMGCQTTPESGLVIQANQDKVVKQFDLNMTDIASYNIEMREMAEVERITEKTKFEILKAAAKQEGKLSAGAALGHLTTFKKNLRKAVDACNAERSALGRARQDYQVYTRLSAEIASYLAKIGKITPEQLRAFGNGLEADADKVISSVAEARRKELEDRQKALELRERERAQDAADEEKEEGGE